MNEIEKYFGLFLVIMLLFLIEEYVSYDIVTLTTPFRYKVVKADLDG